MTSLRKFRESYDDCWSPPTPVPDGSSRERISGAEAEGRIIDVDTAARTFTLRYDEYEHFRSICLPNPLKVDYSRASSADFWLRAGRYIEAEGSYDPTTAILHAYELELESRDDDSDEDYREYDHDDD